jgi:hypothetical protein
MRSFFDQICKARCQGIHHVDICRSYPPWRLSKMGFFDDILEVDFPCPFGLPIVTSSDIVTKREAFFVSIGKCVYAQETNDCCSKKWQCNHPERTGLRVSSRACNITCVFFVPRVD